jgi:hypothetical protein
MLRLLLDILPVVSVVMHIVVVCEQNFRVETPSFDTSAPKIK